MNAVISFLTKITYYKRLFFDTCTCIPVHINIYIKFQIAIILLSGNTFETFFYLILEFRSTLLFKTQKTLCSKNSVKSRFFAFTGTGIYELSYFYRLAVIGILLCLTEFSQFF